MNEKTRGSHWFTEAVASAISVGGFFIVLGLVYINNPNLWKNTVNFFNDFTNVTVPHTSTNLPAPMTPAAHTAVYSAAFQFALAIAILQILVLAVRVGFGSQIRRTAETVGSLVFWFGTVWALNGLQGMKVTLSQSEQLTRWFQFWAIIISLIGISLLVRGVVIFAAAQLSPKNKAAH